MPNGRPKIWRSVDTSSDDDHHDDAAHDDDDDHDDHYDAAAHDDDHHYDDHNEVAAYDHDDEHVYVDEYDEAHDIHRIIKLSESELGFSWYLNTSPAFIFSFHFAL